MHAIGKFILPLGMLLFGTTVAAAEQGIVIRAGELKEQPFVDAANTDKLAANQPVNIVRRQGGWVQVESNGKTGWVRMLNLRLGAGAGPAPVATPRGNAGAKPGLGTVSGPDAKQRSNSGAKPRLGSLTTPASLLRTGSSGKTETTGVKGLGEEDIKNATVNTAELEKLASLAVDSADATANARQNGLKESTVEYLNTKGGRK